MLFRNLLLPTLVVPALGAAVVVVALVRGLRGELADRARGASAAALAFLGGFVALTGWPRWPPVEATQRLFFVVALSAVLAWLVRPEGTVRVWLARALVTAVLLGLLLEIPVRHTWTTGQSVLWLGGLWLAGLGVHRAWSESLGSEGDREHRIAACVRVALLCGIAVLLGLSASARLAQLAGALACGVGVVEVASRVLRARPWHAGAGTVLATAVPGLLVIGYFYADLTAWPALLTVLACVMLGVPTGNRPWTRWLALVPLGLAVALTLAQREEDPYADYYGRLQPPASDSRISVGDSSARRAGPVEGKTAVF